MVADREMLGTCFPLSAQAYTWGKVGAGRRQGWALAPAEGFLPRAGEAGQQLREA